MKKQQQKRRGIWESGTSAGEGSGQAFLRGFLHLPGEGAARAVRAMTGQCGFTLRPEGQGSWGEPLGEYWVRLAPGSVLIRPHQPGDIRQPEENPGATPLLLPRPFATQLAWEKNRTLSMGLWQGLIPAKAHGKQGARVTEPLGPK